MHPVLSKIAFTHFEGLFNVHGTEREVAFIAEDGMEPTALIIRGLTLQDALHILGRLEGGLLKGKDAEQLPLPHVQATPPTQDEDEGEGEDEDEGANGLAPSDISDMGKMEKLRPVIELMVLRGFKSAKTIAELSSSIKDQVPALQEVDKKGNFTARIERAAMVVLGHE